VDTVASGLSDLGPGAPGGGYASGMDRLTEAAALLTLLRDAKSWKGVVRDVEAVGSASKALRGAARPEQGELFGGETVGPETSEDSARQAIGEWEAAGLHLVSILDVEYPQQLLTVHQRPPFLMYQGHLDSRDAGGVAIVGTRKASQEGVHRASLIAKGLAERGVTVVSGLAAGIDTAAHTAALHAGGRTVAVIGTGLRKAYPAQNRGLQEEIARRHLVLSQFWPDSPPTKTSFPMRNAVMSGYSAATVVIEAEWKSGARMQARLALEHGRPVFLLDSLMRHDWAQDYIARGAVVVGSAEDVLERLDEKLSLADELVWA
jgi:DNA processing protein